MGNLYFTSDTHFHHANVIRYSNRPFTSVGHMNESMIANWNSVVQPQDTIYHLGDFSFAKKADNEKLLSQLNGHKHLIKGNHDKGDTIGAKGWASINNYMELRFEDQFLVLCHYAFSVFNKSHHGALNLFGHSHGNHPINTQQVDVGVDCWDYKPCTLAQIRERMRTAQPFTSKDHHQE